MFVVPARFNRNSPDVQAMGPPADTGLWLIEYMCERIGIANLAGRDLLDLGCGTRFADAILNRNIPLRSYFGIEVDKEIIDFFIENCTDFRLSFAQLDVRHPMYNIGGSPLIADTILPVGGRKFDVICMFSVMTHQLPNDAATLFRILRRHIWDDGWLFFSATLEDGDFGYREMLPEAPTANSVYTPGRLTQIVESNGWRVLSLAGPHSRVPIQHSLLCAPV